MQSSNNKKGADMVQYRKEENIWEKWKTGWVTLRERERDYKFIYLLYITRSRHWGVSTYHIKKEIKDSRREAKIQTKEERNFPLKSFTLKAWLQTYLHPSRAIYSCDNPQPYHLVKVKGSSPRLCPEHSLSLTPTILLACLESRGHDTTLFHITVNCQTLTLMQIRLLTYS